MIKKIITALIAMSLVICCLPFASAAEIQPKLYSYYGDDMLFKQNESAILAGTASADSKITVELFDSSGNLVASGETTVSNDGTFKVSFIAPEGSYEEYSIVLKNNGTLFRKLVNVVFGELWLASGQSNMQYPLGQSRTGLQMMTAGKKHSKWLRVLLVPPYTENGLVPLEPMTDIPGAKWINGESGEIYGMSAVAFFFAEEMLAELDMPVGILNASLGGTSIRSWISREAIDGNSRIKNDMISSGEYIQKSDWNEAEQDIYRDMTANYNSKIAPLQNFRISGMIWYQGESDIMLGWSEERYADAFDLLQKSYSDLFGYQGSRLPIIYTQLAAFFYSDDGLVLLDRNIAFTEMQKQQPDSRAVVTIYDVPLTFIPEVGAIHPECKEEIGQRMAFAAKGLVYGKSETYTAATVKEAQIRDGSIYVTFENVGSGLKLNGNRLNGFAVCGENGVYVQAEAEIISNDTVKIWCDGIENPVSASYAYCISNQRSNLYATENGELALPVSPFVTDKPVSSHYWFDRPWADCESDVVWHTQQMDNHTQNYNSWESKNAALSFTKADAFSGENGLNIKNIENQFSVSPLMTYRNNSKAKIFDDIDTNYSDYGKMSFYIRNNGNTDITLNDVIFYKNTLIRYSPAVEGTKDIEKVIPADGKWHCITLDLNRLYLFGNEGGAAFPCGRLNNIKEIKFSFSGENADISLDNIRFIPSTENPGIRFDSVMSNADNPLEIISVLFTNVIGAVAALFKI